MYSNILITKRDGMSEAFSIDKIKNAVLKAYRASGIQEENSTINQVAEKVASAIVGTQISVEEIQDLVEKELMVRNPYVAKKYIIYREWRTIERDKKTHMKQVMDGIVAIEKNDVNLSNANMSAHTPAGQMMTFASEVTKDYANKYLLGIKYARAHRNGDIHIHDLDYYPTKTTTCIQYDLDDLFERGFRTKNGSIRTPQSIQSYATLATIIFQTNQNEQHGGQSIPAFDFFMAKGVRKTFIKHLTTFISFLHNISRDNADSNESQLRNRLTGSIQSIQWSEEQSEVILEMLKQENIILSSQNLSAIWERSLKATRKDTHQAMEGFIQNLNTMHSRGGNQVVFSSINYGTDTSAEGRLLIRELLAATSEGLGQGEVPVFPTPTIGMVGIVPDKKKQMTLDFKNEGDILFLLGSSQDDINASEYLYSFCGIKNSPAPYFNIDEELGVQSLVKNLIREGLIQSAHDVSDGGLFVTLIESAFHRGIGFRVDTDEDFRKDAFLFGEAQGRVVVSVSPEKLEEFVEMVSSSEVDFTNLGETGGNTVMIDEEDFGQISTYKSLYDNAIGELMAHE